MDGTAARIRLALGALLAATLPLAAFAGTATAGEVELRGEKITIVGSGNQERLLLRQRDSILRIDERNPNRSLETTSPGCTASEISGNRARVECSLEGVEKVRVSTGGGNDRVGVGSTLPSRGDRGFCRAGSFDPKLNVKAGAGRDVLELSNGADRAGGGGGSDLILGCRGDDSLGGGGGDDELSGDRGSDDLSGGKGKDWIVGCQFDPDDRNFPAEEPGSDELRGGGGSDFLLGCKGRDSYRAGAGPDDLNTRDRKAEPVRCSTGKDLAYVDKGDQLSGCERTTECTSDNFPFVPCSLRSLIEGARTSRPSLR